MNINDVPRFNSSVQTSFGPRNLIETELIEVEPQTTKPYQANSDGLIVLDGVLYLIPIGLTAVWVFVAFRVLDAWKVARHGMLNVKYLHQVPCKNCMYFTNNPYLKCAVNPSVALTPEAVNCSDYCPLKHG